MITAQTLEAPVAEWMSVRDVAVYAGRHEVTVRKALLECVQTKGKSGLKGHQRKACASWRIHRADADQWIQGCPPARGNRRVSAA